MAASSELLLSNDKLLSETSIEQLCAAILRGEADNPLLLVLHGFGDGITKDIRLAKVDSVKITTESIEGNLVHTLNALTVQANERHRPVVSVDRAGLKVAHLTTDHRDCFSIFVVNGPAADLEALVHVMHAVAMRAAAAGEWRLLQAMEWNDVEARARTGEFIPQTDSPLSPNVEWKLSKPLIANQAESLHIEWHLTPRQKSASGHTATLLTVVTDASGKLIRTTDAVLLRMLKLTVAPQQVQSAPKLPAPAAVQVAVVQEPDNLPKESAPASISAEPPVAAQKPVASPTVAAGPLDPPAPAVKPRPQTRIVSRLLNGRTP